MTKVAIASDHAGYELKNWLIDNFDLVPVEWRDLGTHSRESVDYPDFGFQLAETIASGEAEFGVAVCGTGIGIGIAINRHPKVRAGVCANSTMARLTRIDNNANVLCLGARIVGNLVAQDCLHTFLTTEFEGGGRHERRVGKLDTSG